MSFFINNIIFQYYFSTEQTHKQAVQGIKRNNIIVMTGQAFGCVSPISKCKPLRLKASEQYIKVYIMS